MSKDLEEQHEDNPDHEKVDDKPFEFATAIKTVNDLNDELDHGKATGDSNRETVIQRVLEKSESFQGSIINDLILNVFTLEL